MRDSDSITAVPGEAVESGPERRSVWALVREALSGARQDYTALPLRRAIFLLAVPMVLEMLMESVFAVVDIFWVSKLGSDAVATVTLTESMIVLVYAVAMGLAIGVGAVVARRTGEKDREGAARAAVQAIVLGLCVALVVSVVGILFAPQLLALMGASPEVVAIGSGFTRMMMGGSVTVLMLFLINAAFRGAGDATVAMRTLWLANAINIALGPFLVFGWGPFPQMGVTGAAVATTIGRGVGVLYQLRALAAGRGHLGVRRRHLRIDGETLRNILRISGNAIVQMLIGMTSWLGLVRVVATFGSSALAGYGIAMRIVIFALLPSWGMANAAATLVGQNLGAGRPERSEQAVWRASFYNLIFLGSVGLLFVDLRRADRARLQRRPGRARPRHTRAAHRQRRVPLLRLRHGDHAGVQRSRRHAHADPHQPVLLLAVGDPARLGAGRAARARADRRLRRGLGRLLDLRRRVGDAVPPRALEGREGVMKALDPYQATGPASLKKPPVGPSSGRVASRTMISAPCSTVRTPWWWLRSVAT